MAALAAMTVGLRRFHRAAANGAGHNRWSKVRHHKALRDSSRASIVQRLCARARAAACHGGPDPELNSDLAQVLAQCRAKNVPKASIMAAISAAGKSMGSERLLAVRGPGGSSILIVTNSGDEERGASSVRGVLQREGAALSPFPGGGSFQQRGLIRTAARSSAGCPIGLETALRAAIEAGAEDVTRDHQQNGDGNGEPVLQFLCQPSDVSAVGQRLQQAGLRLLSSGVRLVPHQRVALQAEQRRKAERLMKELRRCPGVIEVIHNIQEPEGEGWEQ